MIFQYLMKKPVLAIGIILFTVFILDPKTQAFLSEKFGNKNLIPNDCKAILSRLESQLPKDLKLECEEYTLVIRRDAMSLTTNQGTIKELLYRTMANDLVSIAQMANEETLRLVTVIYYKIDHKELAIWGLTNGPEIVVFKNLKSKMAIAQHLQESVKVKEVPK
jgi:hypothetical protein